MKPALTVYRLFQTRADLCRTVYTHAKVKVRFFALNVSFFLTCKMYALLGNVQILQLSIRILRSRGTLEVRISLSPVVIGMFVIATKQVQQHDRSFKVHKVFIIL